MQLNTAGASYSLQANSCGTPANPGSLAAGTSCSYTIAFTPNAVGSQTGRIEVGADLVGSPEIRQLFGNGIAPATPGLRLTTVGSLNYFSYEPQMVGTSSVPKSIVISNTGSATLIVSSAAVTTGASNFNLINAGGCATVTAGASCNLDVQFVPAAPNSPNIRSGLVTLATNAGSQTVTLDGAASPNDGSTGSVAFLSAVSRKNHGTALMPNVYDVPIDRSKSIGQVVTIEPRTIGSGHQIVFAFNGLIANAGTPVITDANGQPINTVFVYRFAQNNEVVMNIGNLANATRATVALVNVNGETNAQVAIGFMIGDINGSGTVTAADVAGVKARMNQGVSASNFRLDANLSGTITGSDLSMVKARAGTVLP